VGSPQVSASFWSGFCHLSAKFGLQWECFESPQLRYTHVGPCKDWQEGNDKSDCALYLFTDYQGALSQDHVSFILDHVHVP
jgi:hypothetical protein